MAHVDFTSLSATTKFAPSSDRRRHLPELLDTSGLLECFRDVGVPMPENITTINLNIDTDGLAHVQLDIIVTLELLHKIGSALAAAAVKQRLDT